MLTILIGVTMAMGAALFITRARKMQAATSVRWLHRLLALASVMVAAWIGGTLIGGSVIIVGGIGFASARVKDQALATLLFLVHVCGAITLLVMLGLSAPAPSP
jgi:hypothetical protein